MTFVLFVGYSLRNNYGNFHRIEFSRWIKSSFTSRRPRFYENPHLDGAEFRKCNFQFAAVSWLRLITREKYRSGSRLCNCDEFAVCHVTVCHYATFCSWQVNELRFLGTCLITTVLRVSFNTSLLPSSGHAAHNARSNYIKRKQVWQKNF